MLAALLVAIAIRRPIAGRLGVHPAHGFLLALVFGIVLAGTITPSGAALNLGAPGSGTCDLSRLTLLSPGQLSRAGVPTLNVFLFVPLGLLVGLLPRTRLASGLLVAAVALPFAIEFAQMVLVGLGRQCQSGDVIDNLTGLAVGLLAAIGASAVPRTWPRSRLAAAGALPGIAAVALLGVVLAVVAISQENRPPAPLPSAGPSPAPTKPGEIGLTVHVDSITALLGALADDDVGEIVVANGTYRVASAGLQEPSSLWIDARFANRTRPVVIRAETPGGVTIDGGGSSSFGGLTFVDGVHDQTWEGFVFGNGTPTNTGVIAFGGYAGRAAPHDIMIRQATILRTVTSTASGATDHGISVSMALGGPHDLVFEDVIVDGRGGLSSAFQFFGSLPDQPNAWNVTIRRLSVAGTAQAIILWDPTLHDITIDAATIRDARDVAVRFESPGADRIVLANITSTGSGSGVGFRSTLGVAPPGVTFVNDTWR
jgi:hypothetical protein